MTADAVLRFGPGWTPPRSADPVVVRAMLDLATDWRFWGVVEHRDGRLFAGCLGDVRLFGTTMARIHMPIGDVSTVYIVAGDLVAGGVETSEAEARVWAAVIGVPERRLLSLDDVRSRIAAGGGADAAR